MVARYGLSVHKNSSTLYDKNRAMFLAQADYFTSTSSILKFSSNNLLALNFINFKKKSYHLSKKSYCINMSKKTTIDITKNNERCAER